MDRDFCIISDLMIIDSMHYTQCRPNVPPQSDRHFSAIRDGRECAHFAEDTPRRVAEPGQYPGSAAVAEPARAEQQLQL